MSRISRAAASFLIIVAGTFPLAAGVRKDIQEDYDRKYLNRTFFLKLPLRGARQLLQVRPGGMTPDNDLSLPVTFKVTEQVRITQIRFGSDTVRFELSSIDLARQNELTFRFPTQLDDNFEQRSMFDQALAKTFTEGLTNTELEAVRRDYVQREFHRTVRDAASIAGVDSDFVMSAVSEEIPGVRQAKQQARDATQELASAKQRLDSQEAELKSSRQELVTLRRQSRENDSTIDALKLERETLVEEKESLKRDVSRLEGRTQDYQKQIDGLAGKLDLESSSKSDLSRSLSQLNSRVDTLQRERDDLGTQAIHTQAELKAATEKAEDLSRQLTQAKDERNRLARSLRDLTSDKNSISSRYVESKNKAERLQTAMDLEAALRLEPRIEPRPEGPFQVCAVLLNEHPIGELEIRRPRSAGQDIAVRFRVLSPDTVEFSEDERRLYAALGSEMRIETSWDAPDGRLTPTLEGDESVRTVAPREQGEWTWHLTGEPDGEVQTVFRADFIAAGDHRVPITLQQYSIQPAGFVAEMRRSFSFGWLALGAVLGMVAMLPVILFSGRGGPRPAKRKSPPPRATGARETYVADKQL